MLVLLLLQTFILLGPSHENKEQKKKEKSEKKYRHL